jgi:hypothetical protein
MNIFREKITVSNRNISKSPDRTIFGGHPITGNILVPIDVCLLVFGSTSPDYTFLDDMNNASILTNPGFSLLGKVLSFEPIILGSDIQPIVELDRSSPAISKINSIDIGSIKAKDEIFLRLPSGTIIPGEIQVPDNGATNGFSLIQRQPFPMDIGQTVQAIKVEFVMPVGDILQGSPIFMKSNNKILGMLLGIGNEVLVYPFS